MSTYSNYKMDKEMAKRRAERAQRANEKKKKEEDDLKAYNEAVETARTERYARENPQPEAEEEKVEPVQKPKRKRGGNRGKSKIPMRLWIYTDRRDEYELPRIVADTAKDLAQLLGVTESSVLSSPLNARRRGNVSSIKVVNYLRDDDEFYRWFCGLDDDCDCCCCACRR